MYVFSCTGQRGGEAGKGQNRNFAISIQNPEKKGYALPNRIKYEDIQLASGLLSSLFMPPESQT